MNKTTPRKSDNTRIHAPHVLPSVRDEPRQRRNGDSTSHSLDYEAASSGYYAEVDRLLERIRDEKSFEAQMIRSILGRNLSRR